MLPVQICSCNAANGEQTGQPQSPTQMKLIAGFGIVSSIQAYLLKSKVRKHIMFQSKQSSSPMITLHNMFWILLLHHLTPVSVSQISQYANRAVGMESNLTEPISRLSAPCLPAALTACLFFHQVDAQNKQGRRQRGRGHWCPPDLH